MDGVLVLEDGAFFRGERFGGPVDRDGEVVFNTSLTGYQEILTDPSYAGQLVTLTYPHIGSYGVNPVDIESSAIQVAGLIVRDYHPVPSNWRSDQRLGDWLGKVDVPGLFGIDTRALTLHLRESGALRGVIRDLSDADELPFVGQASALPAGAAADALTAMALEAAAVPSMAGRDLASEVTCDAAWSMGPKDARWHVVVVDFGMKKNIGRQLVQAGCRLTIVPAHTTASEILAMAPDGVMLSNGPGDPEPVEYAVDMIAELLGDVPIFGICLGHQLFALACGARTYKLPFGHRGSNHPVRDLHTGRVEITAQNHGFAVDGGSLAGTGLQISHLHLNDDTVAGVRHRIHSAFSVQFHPEASPGPHDSHHLFKRFVDEMIRFSRTR
ncbi:MAG: glutamine-hydrolyzing carbamoyl-phosphate synthase small subunit [Myxococcales bacterium]|nr:glutamine-hydrolyzing carbamoyl-phosphate synthase small subunit [Myxococcales bacterium]